MASNSTDTDLPRRSGRGVKPINYREVNENGIPGADNASGLVIDKLLGDIDNVALEINSLSVKKQKRGVCARRALIKKDEVDNDQILADKLELRDDDLINRNLEGDLLDEYYWAKVKEEHEEECSKLDREAKTAERQVYLIRKRTEWLANKKRLRH